MKARRKPLLDRHQVARLKDAGWTEKEIAEYVFFKGKLPLTQSEKIIIN